MNNLHRLYYFSAYAFESSTQLSFDKLGRRHSESFNLVIKLKSVKCSLWLAGDVAPTLRPGGLLSDP